MTSARYTEEVALCCPEAGLSPGQASCRASGSCLYPSPASPCPSFLRNLRAGGSAPGRSEESPQRPGGATQPGLGHEALLAAAGPLPGPSAPPQHRLALMLLPTRLGFAWQCPRALRREVTMLLVTDTNVGLDSCTRRPLSISAGAGTNGHLRPPKSALC